MTATELETELRVVKQKVDKLEGLLHSKNKLLRESKDMIRKLLMELHFCITRVQHHALKQSEYIISLDSTKIDCNAIIDAMEKKGVNEL